MATLPPAASLVIVSGLKREAAIGAGPDAISIRGHAPRLRDELSRLAGLPLRMVISFGICGGLDPEMRPGDIVIGTRVASGGGADIGADQAVGGVLERRLADAGERLFRGPVAAVGAPVLTASAKAGLRAATGAVAVDMESLLAGHFARERGLPFAVLRAVSDPASRGLPPLVLQAVRADGGTDIAAVIGGLARSPGQLAGLLAAARDSAAAFRALRRCRALPGLFLGLGAPQV